MGLEYCSNLHSVRGWSTGIHATTWVESDITFFPFVYFYWIREQIVRYSSVESVESKSKIWKINRMCTTHPIVYPYELNSQCWREYVDFIHKHFRQWSYLSAVGDVFHHKYIAKNTLENWFSNMMWKIKLFLRVLNKCNIPDDLENKNTLRRVRLRCLTKSLERILWRR